MSNDRHPQEAPDQPEPVEFWDRVDRTHVLRR